MPPGPVRRLGVAVERDAGEPAAFGFVLFVSFELGLLAAAALGGAAARAEPSAVGAVLAEGAAVVTGVDASALGAGTAASGGVTEADGSALGAVVSSCLPPKSPTSTASSSATPPARYHARFGTHGFG